MTDQCPGTIPFEFDESEPEVTIEFEAHPYEPPTCDYPGCDASLEILSVVLVESGREVDFACKFERRLEQCVWDYLEEREH